MLFFFFKQKTAYEITVRDWSSDVCSSDLRSGDESPSADELVAAAQKLEIEVHVLERDDDATALARDAAGRGAEALGIAGGDGSLAAVAEAALDADVPFVAVPFGTRNHFARDAGFDIEDPIGALA